MIPYRKLKGRASKGGFWKYVAELNPGFPPIGWKDITPYWGEAWPQHIGDYIRRAREKGYLLAKQTVKQNGLVYRRIAIARDPNSSTTTQ